MAYETIIVEVEDHIALITLNRPTALNALNDQLLGELCDALADAQKNEKVRCIVLTGSEKAFAAGADIKMMSEKSFVDAFADNLFTDASDRITAVRKPIIAAVSGYALGGGCEVALACHYRVAVPSAKLGLPEVKLGLIPGAAGTQPLPRLLVLAHRVDYIIGIHKFSGPASYPKNGGILFGIFERKDPCPRHLQRTEKGIDINLNEKVHVGAGVMTVDMLASQRI